MDRDKAMLENFISNWNADFPNYQLKVANLKEPHALMGALVQVFDRLGIDQSVLSESPEDNVNDSVTYYRDLLPVINMTRVVNHLLSVLPQVATINVTHFLQPTSWASHSILLLLFNLMTFNEDKLRFIAPYEEQLFDKSEHVNQLADLKHKLLESLNEQAQEKGKRAERLERLDQETRQLEDELKQETDACDEEKLELEAIIKESRQRDIVLEQKRTHRDALLAELARKKALRVYDADDVKAQVDQATRNVQEAEEKYNSLRATLMQKEDSLKNLQTIKPNLDAANNLLHEITKVSESLMDIECGDLDSDSKEGELDVLNTELDELQATRRELAAARQETQLRRTAAVDKRQHERTTQHSALREAIEKDKRNSERCQKAALKTEKIKDLTNNYVKEKAQGLEEIDTISNKFREELASVEEKLINQMIKLKKEVTEKQLNASLSSMNI